MALDFVHLNVHSNFSILAGTRPVEDLVAAAKLGGMTTLALTDTNGLYAAVEFQMACRVADVRAVFGTELRHDGRRAVLLARDAAGYAEICRLVTRRHLDDGFRLGEALAGTSDHVFVLCGEPALLASLRGRTNVYVEIVCHHDIESRRRKYQLLDVAERLHLAVAATNNAHFVRPDEHRIHRVLCAIRTNCKVGTLPPGEVEHEGCNLRSPGEMAALFDDEPVALANSVHIAWSCNYEVPIGRPRPLRFELPDDAVRQQSAHRLRWRREVTEEVSRAAGHAMGSRVLARTTSPVSRFPEWPTQSRGLYTGTNQVSAPDAHEGIPSARDRSAIFDFLRRLCDEGLAARLPDADKRAAAQAELARELDVIRRLDLTEYFLICWDLVRFARAHGMPCLGRGSAANSLVSYCLYITHVNPLEHNMFFERFLNLERESFPDFDTDFGTDDREVVLDYIFARYGRENVAMICTYNTMHARSAVREVAKALGVALGEIDAVVKRLPHFASPRDLQAKLAGDPARRDLPLDRERERR